MKKVINGKMYNTETATRIASWDNGIYGNDFRRCEEDLYLSKKEQYFVAGSGGAMSSYAQSYGNSRGSGEDIKLLNKEEARNWCEENKCIEALETHFADMLEEG